MKGELNCLSFWVCIRVYGAYFGSQHLRVGCWVLPLLKMSDKLLLGSMNIVHVCMRLQKQMKKGCLICYHHGNENRNENVISYVSAFCMWNIQLLPTGTRQKINCWHCEIWALLFECCFHIVGQTFLCGTEFITKRIVYVKI